MSKFLDWAMELFGLSDEYETEQAQETEPQETEPARDRFLLKAKSSRSEKSEKNELEKKPRDTSFSFASRSSSTYNVDSSRKSKVVNMSSGTSLSSGSYGGLSMVIQQPTSFSDAPMIAKYLKDRQPVVVNLENVDKITAQKIVDFLGGAVYALDGRLTKVANGIVVAVPSNMGITGSVNDEFTSSIFAEIDF